MKKYVTKLTFAILFLLVFGCSPLKRSQVLLVGNYFNTVAPYPSNVQELNERVAKLSLEAGNLNSALFPSDSMRIVGLVNAINKYEDRLYLPDSVAKKVKKLETYISGYYVLAPDGFNIYKTLKSTGESIGGIFGLKSVVSSIVPDKNVEVTAVKRRKIHRHINKESEEFHEALTVLKNYVDRFLVPNIEKIDLQIQRDVQKLFKDDKTISSLDHYFTYNKHFIDFFQKLVFTRKLALSISESIDLMLKTETEVLKIISHRQKIRKDSYQLHQLANDLERIQKLMEESSVL